MAPVAGHLTAAGRSLPGHPVRPQETHTGQDAGSSGRSIRRSFRLGTTFLTLSFRAGPAGGNPPPSAAGCALGPRASRPGYAERIALLTLIGPFSRKCLQRRVLPPEGGGLLGPLSQCAPAPIAKASFTDGCPTSNASQALRLRYDSPWAPGANSQRGTNHASLPEKGAP